LSEGEFADAYQRLFVSTGTVAEQLTRVRALHKTELKRAYRKRAQETHPDRLPNNQQHDAFRSVVAAYELLKLVQEGVVDVATRRVETPSWVDNPESIQANSYARKAWQRLHPQPQGRRPAAAATAQQSSETRVGNKDALAHLGHYFYEGTVPKRPLLFGQFLYYSGRITWRQLIDGLVWQRRRRPLTGQLACELGFLNTHDVGVILATRQREGRFDIPFAEYAELLGYLTPYQRRVLCSRLLLRQHPLGQYYVQEGIVPQSELSRFLVAQRRHNDRIADLKRANA
jgi:hypothetical protein